MQATFSEDLGAAMARAVNDWIAREWLDRDPRLRASIVVPQQNAELAVAEIERCAADRRFVQVLLLVSGELPLGRRQNWPIYAAAERHGLPIGIHAGSTYRHPNTPVGWSSYLQRGLHQPGRRVSDPAHQPDRRGRVRQVPRPDRGADGIRA